MEELKAGSADRAGILQQPLRGVSAGASLPLSNIGTFCNTSVLFGGINTPSAGVCGGPVRPLETYLLLGATSRRLTE